MKQLALTLLALTVVASPAYALSCGDILTANTTLRANLSCPATDYALRIASNGVRLNLNGFTITGNGTNVGVKVENATNARVENGKIVNVREGVSGYNTSGLKVYDIDMDNVEVGIGVAMSKRAEIRYNDIKSQRFGIDLGGMSGGAATNHVVSKNVLGGGGVAGINVCGGSSNILTGNAIAPASSGGFEYGVLMVNSKYNYFTYNSVVDARAGVAVYEGANNSLLNNTIDKGTTGVALQAKSDFVWCTPGTGATANNILRSNVITRQGTAIEFGDFRSGAEVHHNRAESNRLETSGVGMSFGEGSMYNGGRTNTYAGTTTPFVDYGMYNIH